MAALRVVVECNDYNVWALRPFTYLFLTYWSELQPVIVCGYNRPEYALPPSFDFYSISKVNYPADRWSDGLIQFLNAIDDKYIVLMLVDYWLTRTVDVRGVSAMADYILFRDDVLRVDLTTDRLYAGGMFDVESYGCYDVIETPHDSPYQFSLQAGIWNRQLLLSLLQPNKSPWGVEVETQVPSNVRVLGTRQSPVRYANAVLKGRLDMPQISQIPEDHRNYVLSMIPIEVRDRISPRTITETE